MSDSPITERQHFWLDHLRSAEAFDGSVADYARYRLTYSLIRSVSLEHAGQLPRTLCAREFLAIQTIYGQGDASTRSTSPLVADVPLFVR